MKPGRSRKGKTDTPSARETVRPGSVGDREVELAVYRQALERARSDMQAFAHSVSHDLRAPLRAIQGFSKILLEDFAPQIDGEAQEFLRHIINNTQTLAAQMDDLLRFSRAGKNAPSKIDIDTAHLVREVWESLRPDLPPNFTLHIGDLPQVQADPSLFRQALTELIQNAAKFTKNSEQPRAEIIGHANTHALVISIRDNGVGFDPAHAPKLFQVFQKLHSASDFPGNGIGLAIVKRIIEAHGGCVDATGSPNNGATISIALPPRDAQLPLECVPIGEPEASTAAA